MNNSEYGCLKIGQGVIANGDMQVPESAFVAGQVNGKITADHVELEADAKIEGELIAKTIEVAGKVQGKITATEFLSIQTGGKAQGEIEHGDLEVQRGGSIAGTIKSLNDF